MKTSQSKAFPCQRPPWPTIFQNISPRAPRPAGYGFLKLPYFIVMTRKDQPQVLVPCGSAQNTGSYSSFHTPVNNAWSAISNFQNTTPRVYSYQNAAPHGTASSQANQDFRCNDEQKLPARIATNQHFGSQNSQHPFCSTLPFAAMMGRHHAASPLPLVSIPSSSSSSTSPGPLTPLSGSSGPSIAPGISPEGNRQSSRSSRVPAQDHGPFSPPVLPHQMSPQQLALQQLALQQLALQQLALQQLPTVSYQTNGIPHHTPGPGAPENSVQHDGAYNERHANQRCEFKSKKTEERHGAAVETYLQLVEKERRISDLYANGCAAEEQRVRAGLENNFAGREIDWEPKRGDRPEKIATEYAKVQELALRALDSNKVELQIQGRLIVYGVFSKSCDESSSCESKAERKAKRALKRAEVKKELVNSREKLRQERLLGVQRGLERIAEASSRDDLSVSKAYRWREN
ncbi:hypothetical protein QBC44DRAFT_354929 [Cladorrhinum sp. PSN332]|nr:hypothetical protein QBC44DRAFT_354929 [Cladorrhinum sp. PSN332]